MMRMLWRRAVAGSLGAGRAPLFLGWAGRTGAGTDTGRRGTAGGRLSPLGRQHAGPGRSRAPLPTPPALWRPRWRRLSKCCRGHAAATSGAVPQRPAQNLHPWAAALREEGVRSQPSRSAPCQRLSGLAKGGMCLHSNARPTTSHSSYSKSNPHYPDHSR